MIFIGTEFQEDDLKTIINKYGSKGYDLSGNNYFFISPKLNNVRLRRQISSVENYYWIPWTTEVVLCQDLVQVKMRFSSS